MATKRHQDLLTIFGIKYPVRMITSHVGYIAGAGASLAVEAPVADLAGRTVGEWTRLAHEALTGLLAKANEANDEADAR